MTQSPSSAIRMPVKTVTIKFDAIGYEGWWVKMRTNPKASVYDGFLANAQEETEKEWDAWKSIVMEWNFVDEEGKPLPLPKDGLEKNQLPYDIQAHMVREYVEAFNATLRLPKELDANSAPTSLTGAGNRANGSA